MLRAPRLRQWWVRVTCNCVGVWQRVLRQLWMRRLDSVADVEAALRHPALADRAAIENSLSELFFAPFIHQEVTVSAEFERRARWSQTALARMPVSQLEAVAERAFSRFVRRHQDGSFSSLLEEMRELALEVSVELTVGELLEPLRGEALRAVRDFDHAIKLIGPPRLARRLPLRHTLERLLGDPAGWSPQPSYLSLARDEALALPLRARVDQLASVFLGTGTIQLSDTLTHALIALAQHPEAEAHPDADVLSETLRAFPVNASLSRQASAPIKLPGGSVRAGEALTVVPSRFNQRDWPEPQRFEPARWQGRHGAFFAFGAGPRACPARRVALVLCETLLGLFRRRLAWRIQRSYPHRRSLARPLAVSFAPLGQQPEVPSEAAAGGSHWLRYGLICAHTYPRAALAAWPRVWANARAAG